MSLFIKEIALMNVEKSPATDRGMGSLNKIVLVPGVPEGWTNPVLAEGVIAIDLPSRLYAIN